MTAPERLWLAVDDIPDDMPIVSRRKYEPSDVEYVRADLLASSPAVGEAIEAAMAWRKTREAIRTSGTGGLRVDEFDAAVKRLNEALARLSPGAPDA